MARIIQLDSIAPDVRLRNARLPCSVLADLAATPEQTLSDRSAIAKRRALLLAAAMYGFSATAPESLGIESTEREQQPQSDCLAGSLERGASIQAARLLPFGHSGLHLGVAKSLTKWCAQLGKASPVKLLDWAPPVVLASDQSIVVANQVTAFIARSAIPDSQVQVFAWNPDTALEQPSIQSTALGIRSRLGPLVSRHRQLAIRLAATEGFAALLSDRSRATVHRQRVRQGKVET